MSAHVLFILSNDFNKINKINRTRDLLSILLLFAMSLIKSITHEHKC